MRAIRHQTHTRFNFTHLLKASTLCRDGLACVTYSNANDELILQSQQGHKSQAFLSVSNIVEKLALQNRDFPCRHFKHGSCRTIETNLVWMFLPLRRISTFSCTILGRVPSKVMEVGCFFSQPCHVFFMAIVSAPPHFKSRAQCISPPHTTPLPHRTSLWTTLIKKSFQWCRMQTATLGQERWCD